MTTLLDHALSLAAHGWPVFPVRQSKRSYVTGGARAATLDPAQLAAWWQSWPAAQVGLVTGPASGLWVLDVDTQAGTATLDALELQHGPLPATLEARTDSGARHLYWCWPLADIRSRRDLAPGLHVIGLGGYVVAPPSACGGAPYAWVEPRAEPVDAPGWLLGLLQRPEPVRSPRALGQAVLAQAVERIRRAPEDQRGPVLSAAGEDLATHVRAGHLTRARVESELQLAAEAVGVTTGGARTLIALSLGDAREPAPPTTGAIVLGSADPLDLAREYLGTVRDERGRALLRRWRGSWWLYDGGAYRELSDEEADAPIWRWLARVQISREDGPRKLGTSLSRVANVGRALTAVGTAVETASQPPTWLDGEQGPGDLLVVANGLLDLATGALAPHTPALFSTGRMPVAWEPDAPRPRRWLTFLEQLFGEDWQAVELLGEWFGYCLSADTSQQKMLFLVGPKRSGKGTIARVLTALVGTERIAAPTLSGLATPFGLQPLLSRPLAIIADARLRGRTDEGAVLERLLSITGEDSITIDRKNREAITARLPTRLMLLSNELPRLSDASGALASRMLVLELRRSFYGAEDLELEARLLEDLPAILAWAVEGWRRLRERGRFVEPESSGSAKEELEMLGSQIAQCVADEFEVGEDLEIEVGAAYSRYLLWVKDQGQHPLPRNLFGRDLRAACPSVRVGRMREGGGRRRFYMGITTRSAS